MSGTELSLKDIINIVADEGAVLSRSIVEKGFSRGIRGFVNGFLADLI